MAKRIIDIKIEYDVKEVLTLEQIAFLQKKYAKAARELERLGKYLHRRLDKLSKAYNKQWATNH